VFLFHFQYMHMDGLVVHFGSTHAQKKREKKDNPFVSGAGLKLALMARMISPDHAVCGRLCICCREAQRDHAALTPTKIPLLLYQDIVICKVNFHVVQQSKHYSDTTQGPASAVIYNPVTENPTGMQTIAAQHPTAQHVGIGVQASQSPQLLRQNPRVSLVPTMYVGFL
jgi:hypothetical protein